MSSETRNTAIFVGVALLLVAIASATAPRRATTGRLIDRGRPFFPEFTDPNAATSLEVVEFDAETSAARPFKVMNRNGRWTIPSHDNYPADASNRLPSIAASLIALKKDDVASDAAADAERCGVLDPTDETLPTPLGRGTRVTVKGRNETILADAIIGKPVEGHPDLRYVRLPDQKRIYIARIEGAAISTRFEDWIERNLLQVQRDDIDQIVIRNYATDAKTGRVDAREMLALRKQGRDRWAVVGMPPGETIDGFRVNLLVTKLVDLAILDVRPKPANASATLGGAPGRTRFLQTDVADLARKGFYLTDDGQMLSNQGEVVVHTSMGIFYVLRFGEVAYGAPDSRYLFISIGFDPQGAPDGPSGEVRSRLEVLRARFSPWYYLVSNDNFQKIRLQRRDIVKSGRAASDPWVR